MPDATDTAAVARLAISSIGIRVAAALATRFRSAAGTSGVER
jgi:hypothetical protein